MMFNRLLGRKPTEPAALSGLEKVSERAERAKAPDRVVDTFADFGGPDSTVRAAPVEEYLHLLAAQMKELQHELGFDQADFERIVLPMLHRYLNWVHLLPASASHHHSRLGGLAIHGLHVATLAARAAHNSVFDFTPAFVNDTELRSHRRPRWQLGAATAGLMHDVGKILIDQIVTDAATGAVWNPFTQDLVSWATERGVQSYALRFRSGDRLHRHESFSLFLTGQIAGPEVMGALTEFGRDILEAVTMSISGERDDAFGLRKLVHSADMDSSRQDREAAATYWSEQGASSDPVLSRLIDAAAGLVRSRRWRINRPGNPIWVTEEGAYLVWPMAFNAMRQELVSKQNATGIPADPNEVAEIMVRAKVARPRQLSDGTRLNYWSIILPEAEANAEAQNAALAGLLARIGNAHTALFIPEVSLLVSSTTVAELVEIKIARDPTLPQVEMANPTQDDSPGATQDADDAEAGATAESSVDDDSATPTASQGNGEEEEVPEAVATASKGDSHPPAEADQKAGEGGAKDRVETPASEAASQVTAQASGVEPPTEEDEELTQAMALLNTAGPLGTTLCKLAEIVAADPERYKVKDKIRMVDSKIVVLRWPQAVRDVIGPDLPGLAKYLAEHTELLATSMKGQTPDYAQFGIAVPLRINGTPWNVVGLNESLSKAFSVLRNRGRSNATEEIPA